MANRKFFSDVKPTDVSIQAEDGGGIRLDNDGKYIFGAKQQNVIDLLNQQNYEGTVDVNPNNQSFIAIMNENSKAVEVDVPVKHFASLSTPSNDNIVTTTLSKQGDVNNDKCSAEYEFDQAAPIFLNWENDNSVNGTKKYATFGWAPYGANGTNIKNGELNKAIENMRDRYYVSNKGATGTGNPNDNGGAYKNDPKLIVANLPPGLRTMALAIQYNSTQWFTRILVAVGPDFIKAVDSKGKPLGITIKQSMNITDNKSYDVSDPDGNLTGEKATKADVVTYEDRIKLFVEQYDEIMNVYKKDSLNFQYHLNKEINRFYRRLAAALDPTASTIPPGFKGARVREGSPGQVYDIEDITTQGFEIVTFDWDDTLSTPEGQRAFNRVKRDIEDNGGNINNQMFIVTARHSNQKDDPINFAKRNGLSEDNVYTMGIYTNGSYDQAGSVQRKIQKIKELKSTLHFEEKEEIQKQLFNEISNKATTVTGFGTIDPNIVKNVKWSFWYKYGRLAYFLAMDYKDCLTSINITPSSVPKDDPTAPIVENQSPASVGYKCVGRSDLLNEPIIEIKEFKDKNEILNNGFYESKEKAIENQCPLSSVTTPPSSQISPSTQTPQEETIIITSPDPNDKEKNAISIETTNPDPHINNPEPLNPINTQNKVVSAQRGQYQISDGNEDGIYIEENLPSAEDDVKGVELGEDLEGSLNDFSDTNLSDFEIIPANSSGTNRLGGGVVASTETINAEDMNEIMKWVGFFKDLRRNRDPYSEFINGIINPTLIRALAIAAKSCKVIPILTVGKGGHCVCTYCDPVTDDPSKCNRSPSRHGTGEGVDIARFAKAGPDGGVDPDWKDQFGDNVYGHIPHGKCKHSNDYGVRGKEFERLGDILCAQLEADGHQRNAESYKSRGGGRVRYSKAVLWKTTGGGCHYNHIHASVLKGVTLTGDV